jgi:hypothetical protein
MAVRNRVGYACPMNLDLFTIVCEYAGGTYTSQVRAADQEKALSEWAALLRREQPIEGASDQIAQEVDDAWADLVPITGLEGVWCWSGTAAQGLALVNIIRSAQS